jgi:hypothetical protein
LTIAVNSAAFVGSRVGTITHTKFAVKLTRTGEANLSGGPSSIVYEAFVELPLKIEGRYVVGQYEGGGASTVWSVLVLASTSCSTTVESAVDIGKNF